MGEAGPGGAPPPDTTKPTFTWAVNSLGTIVTGTASEACDQTSTPAASAFSFGGTSVTVSTPAWTSATTIDAPILGRILQSETVTVTYTAGANPLRDIALNNADNIVAGAVTNGSLYELETVVDTQLGSWSIADTEYVVGRPISGLTWAAGGGGDGGAVQTGTGGGGELRDWSDATAEPGGYSGTAGTAGQSGATGTATAGGNSTVSDAGGVIVTAVGGSPGVGGVVGTGGAGGTGGSGGTGRAGGAGVAGTGNLAGGATSGSSTAAVTSVPGEPQGRPGAVADSDFPGMGVGGTTRSDLTGRDGGDGGTILTYLRAVLASSRPRVDSIAYGRTTAATTSPVVSLPGTHAANDRLICNVAQDDAAGASMTGWTELVDAGTVATLLTYVRDGDGTDPVTLTLATSELICWHTARIRNAAAVANCSAGSTAYSAAQPNPPSRNHGSVVDALWFAVASGGLSSNGPGFVVSGYPANYTSRITIPTNVISNAGTVLMLAIRALLATQTEDPGTFTRANTTASGIAATVCVPT